MLVKLSRRQVLEQPTKKKKSLRSGDRQLCVSENYFLYLSSVIHLSESTRVISVDMA